MALLHTWYHVPMLIVANWKAYVETKEEAKKLLATAKRLSAIRRVSVVLAPPFPFLGLLAPGNRSKVQFAAQDVSAASVGAATGEVEAPVLRSLGVRYVIVGHSERRAQGESDALILEKIRRALSQGIIPILCVGEKERDEDARYLLALKGQIGAIFSALSPKERLSIIVAYEPVWAIGKHAGESIASADLAEMVLYVRKVLSDYLPDKAALKAKVLYGGSVEPANIRGLAGGSNVDGFLIGHASVDPGMFPALVKALV